MRAYQMELKEIEEKEDPRERKGRIKAHTERVAKEMAEIAKREEETKDRAKLNSIRVSVGLAPLRKDGQVIKACDRCGYPAKKRWMTADGLTALCARCRDESKKKPFKLGRIL